MSRGKRRSTRVKVTEWSDEYGKPYQDRKRIPNPVSLGTIPREQRIVDVHCPADHFIAALVRNGDKPVLCQQAVGRPQIAYVLVGDQLDGLFTNDDGVVLGSLKVPQPVRVRCDDCGRSFNVSGAELQAKRPTPPTLRVPCLYVH
jgi:hypothetical protein